MKVLNIAIVLATVACAFAEASPVKDRTLFKRDPPAVDCTAVCPIYLQSITAYTEVLSLAHDAVKAQVAAIPGLAAIPEATPIHDAITKFVDALRAAETDKFSVAAKVQAVADAAKEMLAIAGPANASIPPNILALVDRIFNAVKNIGETADAYLKAGCATTK